MTQRGRPRPAGLTLFELLVILALLVLLFGLLLPAVLRVRQAASRIQCSNNLKQITLATINAADTYQGRLPPLAGYFPADPAGAVVPPSDGHGTLFFHILPFIEQENLYKSGFDPQGKLYSAWTGEVYSKLVPTYLCNADTSGGETHLHDGWLATSGYAGNFQVFGNPGANTMDGKGRYPASIQDGTSNTIFFAERHQVCGGVPNAWAYDGESSSWVPAFAHASAEKFQAMPSEGQCDPSRAQSPHAGGINVALGDGSVRFVSEKVSPQTWWYACTPAGGEVLGPDW
jgi:prepilin-type processing-associated H-X9-DG protein